MFFVLWKYLLLGLISVSAISSHSRVVSEQKVVCGSLCQHDWMLSAKISSFVPD